MTFSHKARFVCFVLSVLICLLQCVLIIKRAASASEPTPHVDIHFPVLYETYHDQWSKTNGHRILQYAQHDSLHGDALKVDLLRTLVHVRNYFNEHKIPYILKSGTLLGAWRHHGFIPWDCDTDVLLLDRDLKRLKRTLRRTPPTQAYPFQWIVRSGLHSDIIPIKVVNVDSGYYVDIFEAHVNATSQLAFDLWWTPPRGYPLHVIRPTRPCVFENEIFDCPRDTKAFLDIVYSKSLSIPAPYRNVPHPPIYNRIQSTLN